MDIRQEILALAAKYQCDPTTLNDPSIEALFQVRDEIVGRIGGKDAPSVHAEWERIGAEIETKSTNLNKVVDTFSEAITKAEGLTRRSAQALLASRQVSARDKLTAFTMGALTTLIAMGCVFWWDHAHSIDATVAKAKIAIAITRSPEGHIITLTGKRILRSGQSDNRILVEFEK